MTVATLSKRQSGSVRYTRGGKVYLILYILGIKKESKKIFDKTLFMEVVGFFFDKKLSLLEQT